MFVFCSSFVSCMLASRLLILTLFRAWVGLWESVPAVNRTSRGEDAHYSRYAGSGLTTFEFISGAGGRGDGIWRRWDSSVAATVTDTARRSASVGRSRKGHTTYFPCAVLRKSIKLLRWDAREGDCQPSSGSWMSIVFPYVDGGNGGRPCPTDNSGGRSHSGLDSSMLSRILCLLSGPGFITPGFLRLLFPQLSDFSFSFYTSQLSCFRLCRLMFPDSTLTRIHSLRM